jgi:DNA-binding response OmpR family regulator
MSPRILFVDDDVKMCELLGMYFETKGFEVKTAHDLASGKSLIEREPFLLAILDVNLAGESGFDLLDFSKKKWPERPVLMFTGRDVDEEMVKRTNRGRAEGILRKGGSFEELLTAVQMHLPD